MKDPSEVLLSLGKSKFRSRMRLGEEEKDYLARRKIETIRGHAADFIATRLAPAHPRNDGKQTPWRGHPVFVAQHATATCCRSCLEKWHGIEKGRELSEQEREYVVEVIARWLSEKTNLETRKPEKEAELF
jgi:hypothetical protein